MSPVLKDIYAGAAMGGLLADEAKVLLSELHSCSGEHGLMLSAARDDAPAALPLLSCWTSLHINADGVDGDVHARDDENLPFIDHAFEVVVVRHAHERSQMPEMLLREACRVLEPGGVLAVTGVHPFGLWAPWLAWQSGDQPARARWPLQVGEWLRRENVQVERVRRAGRMWPGVAGPADRSSGEPEFQGFGGAFVLMGRKQRSMVNLRPKSVQPSRVPAGAALAPGAGRLCA